MAAFFCFKSETTRVLQKDTYGSGGAFIGLRQRYLVA